MAEPLEARIAGLRARRAPGPKAAPGRAWDLATMALALRWGALCFASVSTFSPFESAAGRDVGRAAVGIGVLVVYGVGRTVQPIRSSAEEPATLALCIEAAACAAVAATTGGWSSPLLLTVGCAFLLAGLLGGARALLAAATTGLAVLGLATLAGHLAAFSGMQSGIAAQRVPELLVMGAIGAYAHRVFFTEGAAHSRLRWMNEIHALLLELHAIAAEHPGLFTVEGAVNATASRLREVLPSDLVVVLLRHPTADGSDQPWEVAFAEGVELRSPLLASSLPGALASCATTLRPHRQAAPGPDAIDEVASSGVYAPIVVRGRLAGLIGLERRASPAFSLESLSLLGEVARRAGQAIDNARSFQRLRTLGADEERGRIARELHDRVGQTLAAVAFNIDRITASLPDGSPAALGPELESLSRDVRTVNAEIREKLAELRGGPSPSLDVVALLEGLLARVETRSTLAVGFDHDLDGRLPDIVEREIWRIACEAIRNAERHSGGDKLTVSLRSEPAATVLEITDDGRGVSVEGALRPDAYGLVGMRERADLIGATLVIDSAEQRGTTVRLEVPHLR